MPNNFTYQDSEFRLAQFLRLFVANIVLGRMTIDQSNLQGLNLLCSNNISSILP